MRVYRFGNVEVDVIVDVVFGSSEFDYYDYYCLEFTVLKENLQIYSARRCFKDTAIIEELVKILKKYSVPRNIRNAVLGVVGSYMHKYLR